MGTGGRRVTDPMMGHSPSTLLNLDRRIRVYLTGGEGIGWALDESLDLTGQTHLALSDLVEASTLRDCDIVYSEDPVILSDHDDADLTGKRIICQLDNDLSSILQKPTTIRARRLVGLWVGQNSRDHSRMRAFGMPSVHIPLAVDVETFTPELPPGQSVAALKADWGIPDDAFLIGNFMRDSDGKDLSRSKEQKGTEIFLSIVDALHRAGKRIHILLVGPRRHWMRRKLDERGIPYTFFGRVVDGDDITTNVVDKSTLNLLYHTLDLYLLSSRWEAGSRVVLEAGATRCPILSTPTGLAPDVLESASLFASVDEGISAAHRMVEEQHLRQTLDAQRDRVLDNHTIRANIPRFREVYAGADSIPVYRAAVGSGSDTPRSRASIRGLVRKVGRRLKRIRSSSEADLPGRGLSVSLWHEFHKPPYGGGNQFMLAVGKAMAEMGVEVHRNLLDPAIGAHLCNSAWFDVEKFAAFSRRHELRMVHRIDGPISAYRGSDREEDDRIFDLNERFASATVLQSVWSYERLHEMGYRPVHPVVVKNAADGEIFNREGARGAIQEGERTRLIASSWSDNPRKGGPVYRWLDEHLDWERFEFTFVGRTKETFSRITHIPAKDSAALGDLLREHDIYLTASEKDPCSNALVEALACGLPSVARRDGGHPELVGFGGLCFDSPEEIPDLLDRVVSRYPYFRDSIAVPRIEDVARTYIEVVRSLQTRG